MKKIIEYIPYELQGIIDYQEIANAIESYYSIKIDELEQIKKNRNIFKCDEETIIYYETLLNIIPKSDATLDERRFAIWLKMNNKIPYSEQWLRHWLNGLVGSKNYELVFNYANYSGTLRVTSPSENNYNSIVTMLDLIMPAHIRLDFIQAKYRELKKSHNVYKVIKIKRVETIKYYSDRRLELIKNNYKVVKVKIRGLIKYGTV